jgi:hypothetical protein
MKFFTGGSDIDRRTERDGNAAHATFAAEAHHHGHIARQIERLHEAAVGRLGHGGVVGLKERELRHIAGAAVGVAGGDLELLRGLHLHRDARGLHGDVLELRLIGLRVGHAFGDPAHERLVASEPGSSFLPPVCGTMAAPLVMSRLSSGAGGKTRRPLPCFTMAS